MIDHKLDGRSTWCPYCRQTIPLTMLHWQEMQGDRWYCATAPLPESDMTFSFRISWLRVLLIVLAVGAAAVVLLVLWSLSTAIDGCIDGLSAIAPRIAV